MSTDDERIGYLAGGTADGLDAADQAELDELRALLADPSLWVEPPAGLEDSVVAAVRAEVVAAGAVAPAVATPADVVPIERASRNRRARIAWGGALAAAAAAILLVVAVVAIGGGDDDDGVTIALGPTELAPNASGTAHVVAEQSGLRIQLDATGLPRRDNGLFYQAWLRNEAGDLVPIGTFHEGDDVTLWAGVPLADYPTLTVTEEAADGDQASSGRRVLVGTVGS